MTHWDGLTSLSSSGHPERILILGATNRIQHIDEAILRRMPKKFPVSLPTSSQRRRILKLVLRDTKIDDENFDLDTIVNITAGLSGSDLKEACRDAAMVPVRELIREKRRRGEKMRGVKGEDVRGLRTGDFFPEQKRRSGGIGDDDDDGGRGRKESGSVDGDEGEKDGTFLDSREEVAGPN